MRKLLAAATAVALVATTSSCGGDEDLSVELHAISEVGIDPFTTPIGTGKPVGEAPPADEGRAPAAAAEEEGEPAAEDGADTGGDAQSGVQDGGAEGLYGDTADDVHCDKAALVDLLTGDEDKSQAWAEARDISPEEITGAINEMTPVLLRGDTLVTNHRYPEGGDWEPFLALLEAGTAVLVDEYGVPAVRCQCGNPLTEPYLGRTLVEPDDLPDYESTEGQETYVGEGWGGIDPPASTVVTSSETRLTEIVATDVDTGGYSYIAIADEEDGEEETAESPSPSPSPEYEEPVEGTELPGDEPGEPADPGAEEPGGGEQPDVPAEEPQAPDPGGGD